MGIGEKQEIIIVDENNKIIGSMIDKDRLEKKEIISRASVAVIQDSERNILLQKRSKHKYVYPGWWDNAAGGVIKLNQTDDECVVEEIFEELGLQISINDLKDCGTIFVEHKVKEFIHVYSYQTKKFTPKNNWEVESTAWKTAEEIDKIIESENISPVCVAAIKRLQGE